jgi:hypothetical protein
MYVINFNAVHATEEIYQLEVDVSSDQTRHVSDTVQSYYSLGQIERLGIKYITDYIYMLKYIQFVVFYSFPAPLLS